MNIVANTPKEFLFTSEISVYVPDLNTSAALAKVYEWLKPALRHTAMLVANQVPPTYGLSEQLQAIKILTGRDGESIECLVREFAKSNNLETSVKHYCFTNTYSTVSDHVIVHDPTPMEYHLKQYSLELSYSNNFSVSSFVERVVEKKYGGECDVLVYHDHSITHDINNRIASAVVKVQAQDAKSAVLLKLDPI